MGPLVGPITNGAQYGRTLRGSTTWFHFGTYFVAEFSQVQATIECQAWVAWMPGDRMVAPKFYSLRALICMNWHLKCRRQIARLSKVESILSITTFIAKMITSKTEALQAGVLFQGLGDSRSTFIAKTFIAKPIPRKTEALQAGSSLASPS
jgi:hypothetical protein